jgi:phosphomannomutase
MVTRITPTDNRPAEPASLRPLRGVRSVTLTAVGNVAEERALSDLSQIVKAYDVRGVVPDQFDEASARALGTAFVEMLREAGDDADRIVIGHDMRDSGPGLAGAFAGGANAAGAAVVHIGLASTDQLYYASGALGLPGAMFTASHNPARYNGIKLCRAGARPVGQDSGLAVVRRRAEELLDSIAAVADGLEQIEHRDVLADYAAHLRSLVDLSGIRPLKVVVDAGNGMGGHTVPAVLGDQVLPALPLDVVPLYFELDGTFPNHEANPLEPANLVDLQNAVREHGADIGLAFDGDADRCFVVDEKGEPVSPSAITALVAARELAKSPGATVIHNVITSAAVPEIIAEHGGTPVRSRVGHSFIKAEMARTNAIFGGEHSAHYYFRDFWYADTGMLAAMHVLAALGGQDEPLSALGADYERYAASGEINSTVDDAAARIAEVRAAYPDATVDELDGLTLHLSDGAWFNLRASNTEPLLRLNVEAPKPDRMAALRDEVLAIVRG